MTTGERRAIDKPGTLEAWRRYFRRRTRTFAGGLAALVLATVVIGLSPDGDPKGFAGLIAIVGISWGGLAILVGGLGLVRAARIRWRLGRRPWRERRCRYRIAPFGANGQPALIVRADEEPEAVCSVSTTVWQYRKLPQGDVELLVCGNPRRWAVVAPGDLSLLVWVKRPTVPGWSRRLRRYAEAD